MATLHVRNSRKWLMSKSMCWCQRKSAKKSSPANSQNLNPCRSTYIRYCTAGVKIGNKEILVGTGLLSKQLSDSARRSRMKKDVLERIAGNWKVCMQGLVGENSKLLVARLGMLDQVGAASLWEGTGGPRAHWWMLTYLWWANTQRYLQREGLSSRITSTCSLCPLIMRFPLNIK